MNVNYYPLLIALGLLFLAGSFLVTHRTGRIALVVLACVAFLIARDPDCRRDFRGPGWLTDFRSRLATTGLALTTPRPATGTWRCPR
jgi:hypothetical protein